MVYSYGDSQTEVRLKSLDNINGITRTVRLSLEFRGLTAQTVNEFVRMQKDISLSPTILGMTGVARRS